MFWEGNSAALAGASIRFVNDGDMIVSVTGLEIRGADGTRGERPYVLDGGSAVINGSLYVSADYVVVTNVHVKGDLVITAAARDAVLLQGVVAEGRMIAAPGVEGEVDRPFTLVYHNVLALKGWVVSRDAAVVHLMRESVPMDAVVADHRAAKKDKPVEIAQSGYPYSFFSPDWYLHANPDLVEAVRNMIDAAAAEHYQNFGQDQYDPESRQPNPYFDVNSYLQQNPDVAAAVENGIITPYEHFMLYGLLEGRLPHPSLSPHIHLSTDLNDEETDEPEESGQTGFADHFMLYNDGFVTLASLQEMLNELQADESVLGPAALDFVQRLVDLYGYVGPSFSFESYLSDNPNLSAAAQNGQLHPPTASPPVPGWPVIGETSGESPDDVLDEIIDHWFGGGFLPPQAPSPAPDGPTPPAGESEQTVLSLSLHFVGSAQLTVSGNSRLELVGTGIGENRMVIDGDAEHLEIHVEAPGEEGSLILQINGDVGKITLSGEHHGNIVFSGTGQVGEIETSDKFAGTARVSTESGLQVGKMSGRMTPQPAAPGSGSDPAPSPQPSEPPVQQPDYRPSVTEVVYASVYPYHAEFKIATKDAEKVYFAVKYEVSEEPDAQTLKEEAGNESEADGMKGTVNVLGGTASFTVTRLAEMENFVLYAAAEAPDGTLSDVFKYSFVTDSLKINDVRYEWGDVGATIAVKLNTYIPRTIYWLLTDDLEADLDALDVRDAVWNSCASPYDNICGSGENASGSDTAEIFIPEVVPWNYRLFVTVEGRELSNVYTLEMRID